MLAHPSRTLLRGRGLPPIAPWSLPNLAKTVLCAPHSLHTRTIATTTNATTNTTNKTTTTTGARTLTTTPRRKPNHATINPRSSLPDFPALTSRMASTAHDTLPLTPHNNDPPPPSKQASLSVLPLPMILRSLAISTVSSSPLLLPPALGLMSLLASARGPLLNPDRNPLLKFFIKGTFYAQFCAGETHEEVVSSVERMKKLGFSGVILAYAKENVLDETRLARLSRVSGEEAAAELADAEVQHWLEATSETVRLSAPGDFTALKFTGAGSQAFSHLAERKPPPPNLAAAIDAICALASARGVRLLFDAEQAAIQPGIDDWTLAYMRRYNTKKNGAVIYGTYQAYLKSCAATVAAHLQIARDEGFVLGVKLVRGAYLGSDPRHLIHDTKEGTDEAYDGIAEGVMTRNWNAVLQGKGDVPEASLVIATHNAESVRLGKEILERGEARISDVVFAQLQGMADEISCELVAGGAGENKGVKAYKYIVWGSAGECMKYLLRRAYENRDAVGRTREGRDAMWWELVRRVKAVFKGV